jgi:hypothetical protein
MSLLSFSCMTQSTSISSRSRSHHGSHGFTLMEMIMSIFVATLILGSTVMILRYTPIISNPNKPLSGSQMSATLSILQSRWSDLFGDRGPYVLTTADTSTGNLYHYATLRTPSTSVAFAVVDRSSGNLFSSNIPHGGYMGIYRASPPLPDSSSVVSTVFDRPDNRILIQRSSIEIDATNRILRWKIDYVSDSDTSFSGSLLFTQPISLIDTCTQAQTLLGT